MEYWKYSVTLVLFVYLLTVLGLHCSLGFSLGEWGLLASFGAWASLCGVFSCC